MKVKSSSEDFLMLSPPPPEHLYKLQKIFVTTIANFHQSSGIEANSETCSNACTQIIVINFIQVSSYF